MNPLLASLFDNTQGKPLILLRQISEGNARRNKPSPNPSLDRVGEN